MSQANSKLPTTPYPDALSKPPLADATPSETDDPSLTISHVFSLSELIAGAQAAETQRVQRPPLSRDGQDARARNGWD